MPTLERSVDPILDYFTPWRDVPLPGAARPRSEDRNKVEYDVAWVEARIKRAQRRAFGMHRSVSTIMIPLFTTLFVSTVIFIVLSGALVGLTLAFQHEPFATAATWELTALKKITECALVVNVLLLVFSILKAVVRTVAEI
jgi:hypothetical protein